MAGYSGTPLPKKLGIARGSRVALISAPEDFRGTLGELPDEVAVADQAVGPTDVIVVFVTELAALRRCFPPLTKALAPKGGLWVAWPKKASGVVSDIREDLVREVGLPTGLVDNKVCAIDEVWSGLRFVHRRQDAKTLI